MTAGATRATIAPDVTSIGLCLPLIAVVLASTAPNAPPAMSAASQSPADRRVVSPVFAVGPFRPKPLAELAVSPKVYAVAIVVAEAAVGGSNH